VTLKVFSAVGEEITTLVNREKSAGSYEINFSSDGLTSGIYFYEIHSGDFIETKKMILLK
jgi:hypothetical protein